MRKKGFTLIELIAVLVILAILALIVTPLVMNIIRKAKISADKRSVAAYGRSIELAIAGYLMDTGDFPTSIEQIAIEYSGDEVECSTTQLKSDSSIYLAGCTVGGRSVDGYTYGKEDVITYDYRIGDEVTYNGVTYYVIEDSDTTNDTVKLLKENPLTVKEINDLNLDGITINGDNNAYGTVKFGNSIDYSQSTVKIVVDAWKTAQAPAASESRLITLDELVDNLGYEYLDNGSAQYYAMTEDTPLWIYIDNCWYWTMTSNADSQKLWYVTNGGSVAGNGDTSHSLSIRPVIIINKNALSD